LIGRNIGNYKITRVLGEGGMGTVYLAEHPMIGKRVAVKMLRPDLGTDPGLVSRFFQEARAVNEIGHPNIVDISDYGKTDDGFVYFVMELMQGRSLRERLSADGMLPLADVVTISRQVCDALAAAHRAGIIHRDLKPDNIFLLEDPKHPEILRSKLFDFGVAKLLGEQEKQVGHKTVAGAVVGTPYYMSPEQALCQDVTAASDIYSMGVVMFEMATGSVPFNAEQLVILLNAILKQPAPAASQLRPTVPPVLDRLIVRCLEKDPGARPQSMEEVIAVLNTSASDSANPPMDMGETMLASPGQAPCRPSAALAATIAPQTAPAARTRATKVAQAPVPKPGDSSPAVSTVVAATGANSPTMTTTVLRVGSARQAPPTLIELTRAWLNSTRIRRAAIPIVVVACVVVVASVFMSHASAPSITSEIMEEQPPPPPAPKHAAVTLASEPTGAEVTRLNDNRILGTTPVVDIRQLNGQQTYYRFRLAGYTEVQMPFLASNGGNFEVRATLEPKIRPEPTRYASTTPAPHKNGKGKKSEPAPAPAMATATLTPTPAPAPAPTPAAHLAPNTTDTSTLPPLNPSVRVRRLGAK
jgi:eukaryotic-like serine/threonine-protein kinase